MVVAEDLGPSLLLHSMVLRLGAPPDQGLFVAPARQRQQPSFPGQAPVADVVDESVYLLQFRFEHLGEAEIGVESFRIDLEQDGEHRPSPFHGDADVAQAGRSETETFGAHAPMTAVRSNLFPRLLDRRWSSS